jgi:hypothetical protein
MPHRIELRWFLDKGNGLSAATVMGAVQSFDGAWPVAIMACRTYKHAQELWHTVYSTFGVNATIELS